MGLDEISSVGNGNNFHIRGNKTLKLDKINKIDKAPDLFISIDCNEIF